MFQQIRNEDRNARPHKPAASRAQSAIEYMVLLSGVVIVVLIGFYTYLPKVRDLSGDAFNKAAIDIMGNQSYTPYQYNKYP